MEVFFVLAILALVGFLLLTSVYFLLTLLDDAAIFIFDKPLFIHCYFKLKKVTPEQEALLRHRFQFYNRLSEKHKGYFQHRLANFTAAYEFIPRQDFEVTQEVKTLIGATYVMLTFGMRHYLINSFDKILLYPETYYSQQLGEYHKGEFNPRLKALVFSWKDFLEGYEISNDNLNLGIHEFTHAIHFYSVHNNNGSSQTFKKHYEQLIREVNYPPNQQRLIDSEYFRVYAYTNEYEFIAVIVEHYFETPDEFRQEFPKLFDNVSKMLNHKP